MDSLLSSIISIVTEIGIDLFSGIRGKIRLHRLKKRLKREIFEHILKKYGSEVYYNDLDQFLTRNDVIRSIINNCDSGVVFHYNTKTQAISYYVQLFAEEHPKYRTYSYEVKFIICKYFEVTFNALNKIPNDTARVVCNYLKELCSDLSEGLNEVKSGITEINRKIDQLIPAETDEPKFDFEKYLKYSSSILPSYDKEKYINRKLYTKEQADNTADVIDALLRDKQLLVLGEAGFGKTYEALTLLRKVYTDERSRELLPVFLPLREYGVLYDSIWSGIKSKLSPFCEGDIDQKLLVLLQNGKIVIIADGIDEITDENSYTKFFIDANDFLAKFSSVFYFFSTRTNKYYDQLSIKTKYYLTGIDEITVRRELQAAGINTEIPKEYYQLFSNPLFLDIGKIVLRENKNRKLFNRSQLLYELFHQLYSGIDQRKGISRSQVITHSKALSILGELAYKNFSKPSFSILEFDQNITNIVGTDGISVISSLVSSGVFVVTDQIAFMHKLIKEFCVAYYLIQNYPLSEYREKYDILIQDDNMHEVFVIISGLFSDSASLNAFLDYVMACNLPLYVECVNSKANLPVLNPMSIEQNAMRILSETRESYVFIVKNYFGPITDLFEPQQSSRFSDRKVGIRGCISNNGKFLDYWFDLVSTSEPDVECISTVDLPARYKEFERKALLERRNITAYAIGLENAGLTFENGRNIAVELIKQRLKDIIDKKLLLEDKYLLCERIGNWKSKVKPISNSISVGEMSSIVDAMVEEIIQENPDTVGYCYHGVELFKAQAVLHSLCEAEVNYLECILPGQDIPLSESKANWIWEPYSDEQKKKRIQLFFYFHQLSYYEMVQKNFPKLYKCFLRIKDYPFLYKAFIYFQKDQDNGGMYSDPIITYYYVASDSKTVLPPLIIETTSNNYLSDHAQQIFTEIQNSFISLGRIAHNPSVTSAGFTFTLTGRHSGTTGPLSDFVYASIANSLEEVFGKFQ